MSIEEQLNELKSKQEELEKEISILKSEIQKLILYVLVLLKQNKRKGVNKPG